MTDQADKGFQAFLWIRILGGFVIAIAVIWGSMKVLDIISSSQTHDTPEMNYSSEPHKTAIPGDATVHGETASHAQMSPETDITYPPEAHLKIAETHEPATHQAGVADYVHSDYEQRTGIAFIEALMAPIEYELTERFWGWRPNDVIKFTDNINEYQLGVLETTRRATTRLTENISRTGSNAVLNVNLERAMNSFMIRSDRYLLPSAENQYLEAIKNLNRYKKQLINNKASFYTRADNLIPLLKSIDDLLGSCDENLVKLTEANGKVVSAFKADNYFYYAKGVASTLIPILHAIETDFNKILEVRGGSEILHQAIESCHHASQIEPWLFVTEGSLNGILANHRANMAAHISHTRFYIGLIPTA
jgi:hypothetical protein